MFYECISERFGIEYKNIKEFLILDKDLKDETNKVVS